MGYGRRFIEEVKRLIRQGKSNAEKFVRDLEEVVVWAKLVRVNDEKPEQNIQGKLTVRVNLARKIAVIAESFSSRTRSAWEDVKIVINRLK